MGTIIAILIIALAIWIAIVILFHKKKEDTINLYSGGPGSGKTLNGVERVQNHIYKSYKYCKKKKLPVPVVYSNIPLYYKLRKFSHKRFLSVPLTNEMLLMQQFMCEENITFIDEFSTWLDQWSFDPKKNLNATTIDEHIRLWRHYHGNKSHLVITDQCSNNIVLQVRRRCNKTINCVRTRFFFGFLAITDYRNIAISEEIKTFEELSRDSADMDDHIERFITWHIPRIIKKIFRIPDRYDDRCYSIRYELAFESQLQHFVKITELKQFDLLVLPQNKYYQTKLFDYTKSGDYKDRINKILIERGIINE